jgi:hypothetical protein
LNEYEHVIWREHLAGKGRDYRNRKKALRSKKCSPEQKSAPGSKQKALPGAPEQSAFVEHYFSHKNNTPAVVILVPITDRHRYYGEHHRATTVIVIISTSHHGREGKV